MYNCITDLFFITVDLVPVCMLSSMVLTNLPRNSKRILVGDFCAIWPSAIYLKTFVGTFVLENTGYCILLFCIPGA